MFKGLEELRILTRRQKVFQVLPSSYPMTLAITQCLKTCFSVQQQIYGWFSLSLIMVNYHFWNNFLESITIDFCNRLYCYPNIYREMAWWLVVIINLTEFSMTMESHLWVYLWGCFPNSLAEQRGINMNMDWTNLWVVVLDWIRNGRWAAGRQYVISCLTLCHHSSPEDKPSNCETNKPLSFDCSRLLFGHSIKKSN